MNTDRIDKRIYTDSFLKYFTGKTPVNELSDKWIETTIEGWNISANKNIIKTSFDKLNLNNDDLFDFLNKIQTDFYRHMTHKTSIVFIDYVCENINFLIDCEKKRNFNSKKFKTSIIILNIITGNLPENEFQNIILLIIIKCENVYWIVNNILENLKKINFDKFNSIHNFDKLFDVMSIRLNAYFIKEKHDIFKEYNENNVVVFLSKWVVKWTGRTTENYQIVNDYLFSIIEKNIFNLYNFIVSLNNINTKKKLSYTIKQYEKSFDFLKLYTLANNYLSNKSLLNDDFKKLNDKIIGKINIFIKSYNEYTSNQNSSDNS